MEISSGLKEEVRQRVKADFSWIFEEGNYCGDDPPTSIHEIEQPETELSRWMYQHEFESGRHHDAAMDYGDKVWKRLACEKNWGAQS